MTTRSTHDRGLSAVARVREVRERDSRLGLQQALTATTQREGEARAAYHRLTDQPAFDHGTAAGFLAARSMLAAMATEVRASRERAETSRTVSDEARRRWQQDRTRLRAVESLLERRAETRRAEADRRETHELDDVAGRMWLRRRTEQTAHDTPAGGTR